MAATIRRVVGRAEHPSDLMIVARRRLLPHLGSGGGRGGRFTYQPMRAIRCRSVRVDNGVC